MIRHRCGTTTDNNMADSNSSSEPSDSASDSSDFEVMIGDNTAENLMEPFSGIQPWRFEPPSRTREAQEREENVEAPRRRCDLESETGLNLLLYD